MKERGEVASPRSDAPEVELPPGFWDHANVTRRETKRSVHLRVDEEVYQHFKAQGPGHLTRMNDVLRAYVRAKESESS